MLFIFEIRHIFISELSVLDARIYTYNVGRCTSQRPTLPVDLTLFRSFPTSFSGLYVYALISQTDLHITVALRFSSLLFVMLSKAYSMLFSRHDFILLACRILAFVWFYPTFHFSPALYQGYDAYCLRFLWIEIPLSKMQSTSLSTLGCMFYF